MYSFRHQPSLTDADDTALNFGRRVRSPPGRLPMTAIPSDDGVTSGPTGLASRSSGIPTQHAMEFTGASSPANYQALLQTVAFQSTSDNPTDFNASPQRTVTWSVNGWRGRYDRNDDDRYRSRERRAPGDGCCNRCVYRERNRR